MNTEKLARAYDVYKRAYLQRGEKPNKYGKVHDLLIKEVATLLKNINKKK